MSLCESHQCGWIVVNIWTPNSALYGEFRNFPESELSDVRVKSNLNGIVKQIGGKRIQMFSPDAGAKQVSISLVRGTQAELVLPELEVYDVLVIS